MDTASDKLFAASNFVGQLPACHEWILNDHVLDQWASFLYASGQSHLCAVDLLTLMDLAAKRILYYSILDISKKESDGGQQGT